MGLRALIAVLVLVLPTAADQAPDASERVMLALRAAVAPALPFPASDQDGVLPADESSMLPWMVRPHAPGDRSIEVIANPLNLANQQRGRRAMAGIQASLEQAQRRAEAQYEQAVADARRTGRSQDVDGVTLADEGIAGARADADEHVTVSFEFNLPAYSYQVRSAIAPVASRNVAVAGAVAVIAAPSNEYRDLDAPGGERFSPAESVVLFGGVTAVRVDRRDGALFEITATGDALQPDAAVSSLVIRLRGNETLIAQILRDADWTQIVKLLES